MSNDFPQLTIFTDGGSRGNPGAAAIGVVVKRGEELVWETAEFLGQKTNNEAEYLAFYRSVQWIREYLSQHPVAQVAWKLDSMLVVEQLQKHWKITDALLQEFAAQIWQELAQLKIPYPITHVPRAQNAHADMLVNRALDQVEKTS